MVVTLDYLIELKKKIVQGSADEDDYKEFTESIVAYKNLLKLLEERKEQIKDKINYYTQKLIFEQDKILRATYMDCIEILNVELVYKVELIRKIKSFLMDLEKLINKNG